MDNKTLGLRYSANIDDAPVSDLMRQANTKTDNLLMDYSDYSWQDFLDTGWSTGAYIILYHVRPIYHLKHVTGPFAQSS